MPEKDGAEEKSTKSVVNKRQKQMMGEEGYDIARDMGRVRPSKDKKDATTMPQSKKSKRKEVKGDTPMQKEFKKKYGKKATALDAVKQEYKGQIMKVEELDLTQVAEAFGGYIVEAPSKEEEQQNKADQTKREKIQKRFSDQQSADASRRRTQGAGDRKDLGSGKGSKRVTGGEDELQGTEDQIKNVKTGTRPVDRETQKDILKDVDAEQLLDRPRADKSEKSRKSYNRIMRDTRRYAAQEKRREKLQDPKFRASETLRKAKQTDIKGGPSVKRGDPVPQEEIPTKKKPVPEIGGFQFNTFKPEIMARRKAFKQGFGQKTGADPVTGKPTYMRPGVLDKDGNPRKAQKRSKNLPDYDTVKTAVDMGLNPDEIDKNKFIDQEVRNTRMKRLGTPDPFDPDYDKKVKKVDQRTKIAKSFKAPKFQTAQRPLEVDRETAPDPEKIASQIKKTGIGFKDFDKKMRDAKVDADIERTIAGKNRTKLSQTQVVGGGGSGGNKNKTRTGSGTPDDPEIVKNGRADSAIDVTNVKEPSAFSKARDRVSDFAKKNPVAALATYDLGKGILSKIMKARVPNVPTPRAIRVSAKS